MKFPRGYRWLFGGLLLLVMGGCLPERLGMKKSAEEGGREQLLEEQLGESYKINMNVWDRPVGWTSVRTLVQEAIEVPTKVKVGRNNLSGTTTTRRRAREVWQALGGGRFRLTTQQEERTFGFDVSGLPPQKKEDRGVLVGRYVVLEKAGETWSGGLETGAPATPEQVAEIQELVKGLNKTMQRSSEDYRRIGEEWEDTSGVFGGEGTLRYRFDRVEEYQGQECAVFSGTLESVTTSADGGEVVMRGRHRIYWSLLHQAELYFELQGTCDTRVFPSLGAEMTSSGPFRLTVTTKILSPKER